MLDKNANEMIEMYEEINEFIKYLKKKEETLENKE